MMSQFSDERGTLIPWTMRDIIVPLDSKRDRTGHSWI